MLPEPTPAAFNRATLRISQLCSDLPLHLQKPVVENNNSLAVFTVSAGPSRHTANFGVLAAALVARELAPERMRIVQAGFEKEDLLG